MVSSHAVEQREQETQGWSDKEQFRCDRPAIFRLCVIGGCAWQQHLYKETERMGLRPELEFDKMEVRWTAV